MYLIAGYKVPTKENEGCWVNELGEKMDFEYMRTEIVATGLTSNELIKDLKEFQKISAMSWDDYFKYIQERSF
jgi:hypothetical protein